mgnify:CR=1 FL=1
MAKRRATILTPKMKGYVQGEFEVKGEVDFQDEDEDGKTENTE